MGVWPGSVEGVVMNRDFWKGKRVLITGHTGFKGSWLSLWLQRLEAEVIGYSLPAPTKPSLFELARVAETMSGITGDVRDLDKLKGVVRVHNPEIVIHMAAQSLVRQSYADPEETYSTNVLGTVNLLEACRCSDGVRVVVIVTSDKCYEDREGLKPHRETDRLGGRDPYSSSKACADLVTAAYRSSFFSETADEGPGTGVATARAGNVIGGGDWAQDRLVPDVITAFMSNRTLLIRYPKAVRPWQHVLEPLQGYLLLAEHLWTDRGKFSRTWNFGPENTSFRLVFWTVDRLADLWGSGTTWDKDPGDHPYEARSLTLDSTQAKRHLKWSPRLSLEESLELTIEWYRAYQQNQDMQLVTHGNIELYEETRPAESHATS